MCAAGTSFSAPHVSGVAALVKAKNPLATNEDIRAHLQTTAEDLGKPGWDRKFGYGLVRADVAVSTSIVAPPDDPVDPPPDDGGGKKGCPPAKKAKGKC